MWGWFIRRKKERITLSDDHRWASLAASLNVSFSHVKDDINHLTSHSSRQDSRLDQLEAYIRHIENRIDSIFLMLNQSQKQISAELPNLKVPKPPQEDLEMGKKTLGFLLENLTEVQKGILRTLAQVTKEIPSGQIHMKDLAVEIYPNKKYSDVRTMMSEYTDKLWDLGLIEKRRKGREVVVYLSKKTKSLSFKKEQTIKQQKKE